MLHHHHHGHRRRRRRHHHRHHHYHQSRFWSYGSLALVDRIHVHGYSAADSFFRASFTGMDDWTHHRLSTDRSGTQQFHNTTKWKFYTSVVL